MRRFTCLGGFFATCQRYAWLALVLLLPIVSAFGQSSPQHGPPQVGFNGSVLQYESADSVGGDAYVDSNGNYVWIDRYQLSDGNFQVDGWYGGGGEIYGYEFNQATNQFLYGGSQDYTFVAVSSDGTAILGTPSGVTFNCSPTPYSIDMVSGESHCGLQVCLSNTSNGTFLSKSFLNDGTYFQMFLMTPDYGYYISPCYGFVSRNGDLAVTMSSEGVWTTTNINTGSVPAGAPCTFYLNGIPAPGLGATSGGGDAYWAAVWYQGPSGIFTLEMGVSNGTSYCFIIDPLGNTLNVDTNTWAVLNPVSGENITLLMTAEQTPVHGPPYLDMAGSIVPYQGVDGSQSDIYSDNTDVTVTIASDGTATAFFGDGSVYAEGTYAPSDPNATFGFDGGTGALVALDANGNPIGRHSAIVVGTAGWWSNPMTNLATSDNSGTYTPIYQRPDKSYGVVYTGVTDGAYFLAPDQNGNYSSSLYQFHASGNGGTGMIVDDSSGCWPPSNAYPPRLYVNNVPWQLSQTSKSLTQTQISSSADLDVSGQASYYPPGSKNSVITLNWSMTGGYSGPFVLSWESTASIFGSNLSPTWDGYNTLLGNSGSTVISLAPIQPKFGPPQIDWNGITLTFDPAASFVNGVQGNDVYTDNSGLGLKVIIAPGSSGANPIVTFYPAGDANGTTTFSGTYNPTTYAFTMNTPDQGAAYAMNSQGLVIQPGGTGTGVQGGLQISGNLDIQGNLLTFGDWTTSSNGSAPGLTLTYSDQTTVNTANGPKTYPAMVNFATSRQNGVFSWSHAASDNSVTQNVAMQLDAFNRLLLFSSDAQPELMITLDPTGASSFKGPVLVAPQGDLDMGIFQGGPTP